MKEKMFYIGMDGERHPLDMKKIEIASENDGRVDGKSDYWRYSKFLLEDGDWVDGTLSYFSERNGTIFFRGFLTPCFKIGSVGRVKSQQKFQDGHVPLVDEDGKKGFFLPSSASFYYADSEAEFKKMTRTLALLHDFPLRKLDESEISEMTSNLREFKQDSPDFVSAAIDNMSTSMYPAIFNAEKNLVFAGAEVEGLHQDLREMGDDCSAKNILVAMAKINSLNKKNEELKILQEERISDYKKFCANCDALAESLTKTLELGAKQ